MIIYVYAWNIMRIIRPCLCLKGMHIKNTFFILDVFKINGLAYYLCILIYISTNHCRLKMLYLIVIIKYVILSFLNDIYDMLYIWVQWYFNDNWIFLHNPRNRISYNYTLILRILENFCSPCFDRIFFSKDEFFPFIVFVSFVFQLNICLNGAF